MSSLNKEQNKRRNFLDLRFIDFLKRCMDYYREHQAKKNAELLEILIKAGTSVDEASDEIYLDTELAAEQAAETLERQLEQAMQLYLSDLEIMAETKHFEAMEAVAGALESCDIHPSLESVLTQSVDALFRTSSVLEAALVLQLTSRQASSHNRPQFTQLPAINESVDLKKCHRMFHNHLRVAHHNFYRYQADQRYDDACIAHAQLCVFGEMARQFSMHNISDDLAKQSVVSQLTNTLVTHFAHLLHTAQRPALVVADRSAGLSFEEIMRSSTFALSFKVCAGDQQEDERVIQSHSFK